MRFITGEKIFDGKNFLPENSVLVLDGSNTLLNIVKSSELDSHNIERYEGILCPGFVNAHCHLELSHMKGLIAEKTGLINFAKGIITKRNTLSGEQQLEAIRKADEAMYNNGIVAVGDICNGPETFETKSRSKIFYHSFIELIGLNPTIASNVLEKGKEIVAEAKKYQVGFSFAPHAPYSVSKELMEKISEYNSETNSIASIHNQESEEENKFFLGEKSGFYDLYNFLGLDISWFQPSGKNSLQTYLPWLVKNKKLILVHNTFSHAQDLDFAQNTHQDVSWCLCPNANLYIENCLPDVMLLNKEIATICLGTDSLTSNHSLSIVDEMNVLSGRFLDLAPELILKWATCGGAKALGIEDKFGSFIEGRNAGINQLSYDLRQFSLSQKLA
jgi:cytosine/adenosine deaminase-related metal-dependent hydrolase